MGMLLTGKQLRKIRLELKMTQREFAELARVHRITVVRWETGVIALNEKTSQLIQLLAEEKRRAA